MFSFVVGDTTGRALGTLDALVEQVVWRKNGVGQVTARVPRRDVAKYGDLLRFGAAALLQFDNGLPDWGGILDTPRQWEDGTISINGYSGERLLALRQTGRSEVYMGASAGKIFRDVIVNANNTAPTGLEVGSVWYGGELYDQDYHYKELLAVANELVEFTGGDFFVTPSLVNGRITFTAHFAQRRGRDHTNLSLVDGRNVTKASLNEQGTIINLWHVAGSGNTWGASRPVADRSNLSSMGQYRRREGSSINSSVSSTAVLGALGDQLLAGSAEPVRALTLEVLNSFPARFSEYDVGDSLEAYVPRFGFDGFTGRVQVFGREYMPQAGVCNLLVGETE